MRKTGLILGIVLLLTCVSRGFAAPKYEMRGLWVATVYGICLLYTSDAADEL